MYERTPLYLQIQDYIKGQILSGKLQKDERIPSEKELMEKFSVSRITIVNALAGLAKDRWIYRIPGRGSFVLEMKEDSAGGPEVSSHQLQLIPVEGEDGEYPSQAKRSIGLIMPGIDDYYSIRLIKGIQEAVAEHEFSLNIMLSNGSKELESRAIKDLLRQGAEGLIIFPVDAETYNDEILALKVQKYPFILIDRYLPGVETSFICSDGALGAQMAVSHLWELGHRNISICSDTPLPNTTVEDRLSGYMKELKQREAMINPELLFTETWIEHKNIEHDHPLVQYMKRGLASAYISINANMGLLIYRIAGKIGLRVPEDISILAFDDPSPGFEETGFLTHISQSENEMGRRAVQVLADMLTGRDNGTWYQKIVLEPKLVLRKSTAAPAGGRSK